MLTLIEKTPFDACAWPGGWVWAPGQPNVLDVVQFSRRYAPGQALPTRLHVSADNRYKLYINGDFEGLGPQCGCLERYFFDTYELPEMNESVVTAIVWHDRDNAPAAQISSRPGFLVIEEYPDGQMIRPVPNWRYRRLHGNRTLTVPERAMAAGPGYEMTGCTIDSLCPSSEMLEQHFEPVEVLGLPRDHAPGGRQLLIQWELHPRTIPAMLAEQHGLGTCRRITLTCSGREMTADKNLRLGIESTAQGARSAERPAVVPANSTCRILLDTERLIVGYPLVTVSGGAGSRITLTYQEALQSTDGDVTSKGNRNEIDGRVMVGVTDVFTLHGETDVFCEPLLYRCWRYLQIDIETSDQALEILSLSYRSTGYPFELQAQFEANEWLTRLVEPGFRTLRLCSNETFMDCPYYERLQYIADTRIQALTSYVLSGDDRLGAEAIEMFDILLTTTGLTQCLYPHRFRHPIPPFALFYIAMLNDFLMWCGDVAFVHTHLDTVDTVLRAFDKLSRDDGLIGKLPGWAFVDWVREPGWETGAPPAAGQGDSFLVSFLYLYSLQQAANVYQMLGHDAEFRRVEQRAKTVRDSLREKAFDEARQVFIDDPSGMYLSQHSNIMAILTDTHLGVVDGQGLLKRILDGEGVSQATVYFKFYLFEAMQHIGRADLIWPDLKVWHDMLDNGLTTFAETPEPTRSDCHGWSTHPLYHFIASIVGIRPRAAGCSAISVQPMPAVQVCPPLPDVLSVRFASPHGDCYVRLTAAEDGWTIHKELPAAVTVSDSDSGV